jgi:glycosyltransferase involved in cell wall biosynthesis
VRTELTPHQQLFENLLGFAADFRVVNNQNAQRSTKAQAIHIPNAISASFFSIPPKNPTTVPFEILIVARIDPRKDHITLLKALHILKEHVPQDLTTTLLGEVSDSQTQQLIDSVINDLGLHEIVQQLPATTDVIPYYASASVTVLPSTTEGFPNAILEALATGTPAIVSEAANKAEMIVHGYNGWVFPTGDSQRLAQLLETARNLLPDRYTQMAENCRSTAAPFTISRTMAQYAALYERAISRS